MANIDHAAALKAAKKRVWYLENRERLLAEAKQKRDAAKASATPVTQTIEVTKVNGQYSLQLNGVKLVLSADNQVTISKVAEPKAAVTQKTGPALKANGQPYKTTPEQRAAVRKWQAANKETIREYNQKYYEENKDTILDYGRNYRQTPRGKETHNAAVKRYYDANKVEINARRAARRAEKTSKLPALNTATLVPFGQHDVSEFSMIRNILK